jgi:hypothetical protein
MFEVGPHSRLSLSSIDTINTVRVIFNDFGSILTFFLNSGLEMKVLDRLQVLVFKKCEL